MTDSNTFHNEGGGPQNNNTGSGNQTNNTTTNAAIPDVSKMSFEDQIGELRKTLKKRTKDTAGEDVAIAEVAKAEKAAKENDENTARSILVAAGKWVLDIARELGIKLAAETIAASMK